MPVSSNYKGRTVDLLLFQIVSESGTGPVTLSFSDNPKICTGVQKLAQIFTTTFFTVLGSILADKTYGVDDVGTIGTTNVVPGYTEQVFQLAVFDTLSMVQSEQDALNIAGVTIKSDEFLTNAEIVSLSAVQDKVFLKVKLTTLAGTSRVFIIPTTTALGLTK